ncbi:MAG: hypothetical protein ACRDCE_15705 [Cetobacterium sp.]|uniref:hypothetical protein n=1 Tax=Cetobacterium sp. TaxID=2071632 RepID=UPI003EE45D0E
MEPEEIKKKYLEKIRATYKETQEVPDLEIETQLEFAEVLVNKDIKNRDLDEDLKDMGVVYLTCHYLYLNYSKVKKDGIQGFTSLENSVGVLGKGLEASPFGQQYMLISNKKTSDSTSDSAGSSGILIL